MNSSYEKSLKLLRLEIDRADRELVQILSRRMKVVRRIGVLKKKYSQPVLQSVRFSEILKSRAKAAKKKGLSQDFALRLLKLIHNEAVQIQKKIRK
jgi:chorismate mutase